MPLSTDVTIVPQRSTPLNLTRYIMLANKREAEKLTREQYRNSTNRQTKFHRDLQPSVFSPTTQSNIDSNGKSTQSAKEYRIAQNLCLFDGGNHPTHLCPKLIEKCRKDGKPLPLDPAQKRLSLNNSEAIVIEGTLERCGKISFLVDGASQVNAVVPSLMKLIPNR